MTAPAYDPKLSALEVSKTISSLGIKKANSQLWQLFLLAGLAGLYIGIGGHASLVASNEGLTRVGAGLVFSIGLVLITIAGAELFTGNVTMFVGAVTGHYPIGRMLRNWTIVYLGNLAGSYLCAVLVFWGGLVTTPEGQPNKLGELAVGVSDAKIAMSFGDAFFRGILCNILVILAIILAFFAKDIVSKILCCMLPIAVFVISSYEHCVANMYLMPIGLFAKGASLGGHLEIWRNLIPVTLGNIVGGIFIMMIHPNRIRQVATLYRQRKARIE